METEAAIERMRSFHTQLREMLVETVSALERAEADTVALAGLRWRFVRALREYQLFKHGEIFDPIIRSATQRAQSATDLKKRCEELGAEYNNHIRRWNLSGIGPASPEYGNDARRIIRRVTEHLQQEELGIRSLLVGMERTRKGGAG